MYHAAFSVQVLYGFGQVLAHLNRELDSVIHQEGLLMYRPGLIG